MTGASGAAVEDTQIEQLLAFIRDVRGFDFTGYKRATLQRRLAKRMHDAGVADVAAYRDRLETDPGEFEALFDTVLINVTSFFRDPECWDYLRAEVIPVLVDRSRSRDGNIRVWSAGCASGQETYSLAMSFAQALGEEQFDQRVKIYGTDVDEAALAEARAGEYSDEQMQPVPTELRDRYFTARGRRFAVNRGLRHRVIFGRHDLTADAPISRVDLIACRNTLMYFNAEAQSLIVDRLHFGLRPDGALFLGRAEMLLTGRQFSAVSVRARVFRRSAGEGGALRGVPAPGEDRAAFGTVDVSRLESGVVESAPDATLVIGPDGVVALANRAAHNEFGLSDQDVGRPFGQLPLLFRLAQLRAAVERAAVDGPVTIGGVAIADSNGQERLFDVLVRPLLRHEQYLGAAVTFTDLTETRRLASELERHRVELETTQEQLRAANEELEAGNEELQSMNEELETTNEELQSTNEELETTNEELQSTNEELETMNEEIRLRSAEADENSAYLQGVLASVTAGVAVLDGQSLVRLWNRSAEQMWGLRADEVAGESFFALDFGLPTSGLRDLVADALHGQTTAPVRVEAINRLGRALSCSVRATPLRDDGHGVVLVIEESPHTEPGADAPPP